MCNRNRRACARPKKSCNVSRAQRAGLNGIFSNASWPDSMREKSKTSLRIESRLFPDVRIVSSELRWAGVSSSSSSRSVVPSTPFNGVRIS